MGLSEYRRLRDFTRTPEPAPAPAKRPGGHRFVVQKHSATQLHYDLRLQVGDVLRSWAVPKGPSLDPRQKRLAIQVEDHPLEYADFEGVIPGGQYGAGPMMIWDLGSWTPEGDAAAALADGMLKFRLDGQRLRGRWMLVRTNRPARQPQWLLVKERDADASAGVHAETFATSATTGRSMDEIAAGAPARETPPAPAPPGAASLDRARPAPMPTRLKPQLASPAQAPPDGDDWLHEVKFDGYRLLAYRRADSVRLLTRAGLDWTSKLPDIAAAIAERLTVDAVLDGEAVVLDSRGLSDFQALQNAIHNRRSRSIIFLAFDLPWCDGHDLTRSPLSQRHNLLAHLLGDRQDGRLRLSEHVRGGGPTVYVRAVEGGLEGIVSKRAESPYTQTRSPSWVKIKCFNQQEFVIGGHSPPEGSRAAFGALLLGYYDDAGSLQYAGRVGTGFSAETLKTLSTRMRPLTQPKPPFAAPPTGPDAKGVTWIRPQLVAQVQFRDWTGESPIRHASCRGLREDLDPASVRREPHRTGPPPAPPPTLAPAPDPGAQRLTNPDRIVFPDRGGGYTLTKRQVAEYYQAVAPRLLEHLGNRPFAILRCPDGEGGKSFFQKHPAKGMPPQVDSVEVPGEDDKPERHLMIRDAAGLLGLVQLSAIEFHPWGARADSIESPDRIVFDLDPGPGVTWKQTVEGALMVRDAIAQVGLRGFARTTGGKGIHVVIPLLPGHTWEQVKIFTKAVAETLVRLAPRRFVAVSTLKAREGRIYIDYHRNTRGATAVASYSLRARPGAPVALPVSWDELAGLNQGDAFSPNAVLRRLRSNAPDPWQDWASSAGRLQ